MKLSANAGTEINMHWQVMIACIETSDVKFTGIIEIFEFLKLVASLIYCSCEADLQTLHLFQ